MNVKTPRPFAELAVTSNFSFLRGGSHPQELVAAAARLGHAAIGIADRNTLAGAVRAHVEAKERKIRLVVGVRLVLTEGFEALCFPTDRAAYGRLTKLSPSATAAPRRASAGFSSTIFPSSRAAAASSPCRPTISAPGSKAIFAGWRAISPA